MNIAVLCKDAVNSFAHSFVLLGDILTLHKVYALPFFVGVVVIYSRPVGGQPVPAMGCAEVGMVYRALKFAQEVTDFSFTVHFLKSIGGSLFCSS